MVLSFALVLA